MEASEERKRKAKQLEMQRKEAARAGRAISNRTPSYPTYTPTPQAASVPDTYDAYNAEKKSRYGVSIYHSFMSNMSQGCATSWKRHAAR